MPSVCITKAAPALEFAIHIASMQANNHFPARKHLFWVIINIFSVEDQFTA